MLVFSVIFCVGIIIMTFESHLRLSLCHRLLQMPVIECILDNTRCTDGPHTHTHICSFTQTYKHTLYTHSHLCHVRVEKCVFAHRVFFHCHHCRLQEVQSGRLRFFGHHVQQNVDEQLPQAASNLIFVLLIERIHECGCALQKLRSVVCSWALAAERVQPVIPRYMWDVCEFNVFLQF